MKIPFYDLYNHHKYFEKHLLKSFKISLKKSEFIGGNKVKKFEENFAKMNGSMYCTSVANGTDALLISLKTLKLQQNDEVIVPAHSWISSSETVSLAGGKPIFCDVSNLTFNIDTDQIEKHINNKTVGIIAVHLYGNPANMKIIKKISKKYRLWIIEDCAQAHFASINGVNVGNFGDMASFSFFPGKNIGALGDAGAILTNKKKLFNFAYKFGRHGSLKKHHHEFEGMNSRLDTIQAEFLNIKLKYFKKFQLKRSKISNYYNNYLENELIEKPYVSKNYSHAWHQYVIKSKFRDKLKKYLFKNGIETRILYPNSLPFLKAYKKYKLKKENFPNAYRNQKMILSIPNDPGLSKNKIFYIINKLNSFKI